jgi:tetratricopeptide (TPR) repeat protein
MTAALAKEMGLTVRYQNVFGEETWGRNGDFYLAIGHVNLSLGRRQVEAQFGRNEAESMTIDFLPPSDLRGLRTWVIDEATIVAMYLNNRAVEALTTGSVDDAYWYAREAIVQQPRFMSAYNTLGVVYQKHGDLAQAQRALQFVLEREPANTRAMSNLALVLHDQGRLVAAAELTRKLEQMEPDPPFGYFKRGQAAMEKGDYKLAKDMFTKEVDRAAYYHEFHFWLALANVGLGDAEGARKHMAIAIENSTTRKDHDLYAAKLARLQGTVPVVRR